MLTGTRAAGAATPNSSRASNDAVPRHTRKDRRSSKATRYLVYTLTILALALVLYAVSYPNTPDAVSSIELSLLFPLAVFSYMLSKGGKLKGIVKDLGLSKSGITIKNVVMGALLFALIILTEMLIGAFSAATGIPLPTNVQQTLAGMPVFFLLFTFLIAPIDEEILFRGFLVPRLGLVPSALLFAVPHLLAYASWSEFFAAFVFGLLAGYFFKRYRSLYTTIFAHALVNFVTVASIMLL